MENNDKRQARTAMDNQDVVHPESDILENGDTIFEIYTTDSFVGEEIYEIGAIVPGLSLHHSTERSTPVLRKGTLA